MSDRRGKTRSEGCWRPSAASRERSAGHPLLGSCRFQRSPRIFSHLAASTCLPRRLWSGALLGRPILSRAFSPSFSSPRASARNRVTGLSSFYRRTSSPRLPVLADRSSLFLLFSPALLHHPAYHQPYRPRFAVASPYLPSGGRHGRPNIFPLLFSRRLVLCPSFLFKPTGAPPRALIFIPRRSRLIMQSYASANRLSDRVTVVGGKISRAGERFRPASARSIAFARGIARSLRYDSRESRPQAMQERRRCVTPGEAVSRAPRLPGERRFLESPRRNSRNRRVICISRPRRIDTFSIAPVPPPPPIENYLAA